MGVQQTTNTLKDILDCFEKWNADNKPLIILARWNIDKIPIYYKYEDSELIDLNLYKNQRITISEWLGFPHKVNILQTEKLDIKRDNF